MRHGRRSMTTSRDPNHPQWVCLPCGTAYGRGAKNPAACWHMGRCDICRQDSSVTQVRDFGQLRSKLEEGERSMQHTRLTAHGMARADTIRDAIKTTEAELGIVGYGRERQQVLDRLWTLKHALSGSEG